MVTRHLKIDGRVQGVGFRYHMSLAAREMGVTGWVRNRHDGSVEAMVSGTSDAVDKIIAWARQGPGHAVVTGVEVAEDSGSYASFDTLPTA
jgi:acylphosphatase